MYIIIPAIEIKLFHNFMRQPEKDFEKNKPMSLFLSHKGHSSFINSAPFLIDKAHFAIFKKAVLWNF